MLLKWDNSLYIPVAVLKVYIPIVVYFFIMHFTPLFDIAQIKHSECFSTPSSYANKYTLFELKSYHCPRSRNVLKRKDAYKINKTAICNEIFHDRDFIVHR